MRALILTLALLVAGCASRADLGYRPPATDAGYPHPLIGEIRVIDHRGAGPRSLGAVMGPNGTPLKRLETEATVAEAVRAAFHDALAARGDLAPSGAGRYDLEVTLLALSAQQWAERHGEADLLVRLIERDGGREAYSARTDVQSRGDNYLAMDNMLLGSPTALNRVADAAMNHAINDTLDQSGFRLALR